MFILSRKKNTKHRDTKKPARPYFFRCCGYVLKYHKIIFSKKVIFFHFSATNFKAQKKPIISANFKSVFYAGSWSIRARKKSVYFKPILSAAAVSFFDCVAVIAMLILMLHGSAPRGGRPCPTALRLPFGAPPPLFPTALRLPMGAPGRRVFFRVGWWRAGCAVVFILGAFFLIFSGGCQESNLRARSSKRARTHARAVYFTIFSGGCGRSDG